ncbi:NAD(P)/FAD-dependent oxidoreductase [Plantactinospora sp. GCM10030261]|uniref:NAD(P)/FAD-dependent oxidoreductase n=1 Tax=Plantactinospora sp. GCM10030261 TaxID=3273420 RepID=UPI00360E88F3
MGEHVTHAYDAVIVGARVAGAATAIHLARAGLRVLLLDQAAFPSDTLSSHQVQVPGVARLRRLGVLDQLRAAGTPATHRIRLDTGHTVLEGDLPPYDGIAEMYSPRRTVLDALLVATAETSGVEIREKFRVTELCWDGTRVVGVRGHRRSGGRPVDIPARLVVGADGKRSIVATAVRARAYRERPALAVACYAYWTNLPAPLGEMYQRPRRAIAVFPTNDDLTMVYVAAPRAELAAFRRDPGAEVTRTLDGCGDLADRVRAATRVERFRIAAEQPNAMRMPYGPGWALVGDAGVVLDSITAQGISNALRDAELLATAVISARYGVEPARDAYARFHRDRDATVRPVFDFTTDLATFRPPGMASRILTTALAGRPAQISRFLGMVTGSVRRSAYFSPGNLASVFGPAGLLRIGAATVTSALSPQRPSAWDGYGRRA